ncbi:hypothetical protein [Planococcus donghaensis]|uniref:hypothetical protein n=1 Tax=Planococcus donghaensis TaxID=414778 RepID=UPI003736508E
MAKTTFSNREFREVAGIDPKLSSGCEDAPFKALLRLTLKPFFFSYKIHKNALSQESSWHPQAIFRENLHRKQKPLEKNQSFFSSGFILGT